MSGALTINAPHVVHETIDGETILIHLGTGTYYSLDGIGAEVWELVAGGLPDDELAARIATRYEAEPALVQRRVGAFVDELVQEGLLMPSASASAPVAQQGEDAQEPPTGRAFVEPVLHKYTDMQEFMLVDPLHDVEADAGWPHVKAG